MSQPKIPAEAILFIKKHAQTMGATDIAKHLRVRRCTVVRYIKLLGLEPKRQRASARPHYMVYEKPVPPFRGPVMARPSWFEDTNILHKLVIR